MTTMQNNSRSNFETTRVLGFMLENAQSRVFNVLLMHVLPKGVHLKCLR